MSYSDATGAARWFSTPEGPMRQYEVAPSRVPAHWYIDRNQHWRAFADSDCKPTRPPTWYRRESVGEQAAAARRAARAAERQTRQQVLV